MNTQMSKSSYALLWGIYAIGLVYFMYHYPSGHTRESAYLIVYIAYILMIPLFLIVINRFGLYFFEPITMVMVLTLIMYFVWPMFSIINNDTTIVGFEVFDYCLEGTLIAAFSVIAYLLGYYSKGYREHTKVAVDEEVNNSTYIISDGSNQKILMVAYLFAVVGIISFILDMFTRGYSLSYMLSLGLNGVKEEAGETGGVLLSIASFMYPAILYIFLLDKNKLRISVIFLFALLPILTRGTRQLLVLLLLSPVVLSFIKDRKKPSMKVIVLILSCAIVLTSAVQYYRAATRTNSTISQVRDTEFSAEYIYDVFSGNFDMYKTLYGVVQYFPEKHDHTMGNRLIVSTAIQFIPSSIWKGKPTNLVSSLKREFLGPRSSPWTIGQLAEIYCDFSVIGCIVLMFIFGRWCRKLWIQYLYGNPTIHNLVYYALMYSFLFALVMRGSTYTNFWMMVFMVIPIWCIKLIQRMG